MTGADAEPAVTLRHLPVVGCAVCVLLVLARLTGSANCATDFHRRSSPPPGNSVDLTELRRNIVQGLKLDRIPDMTKVDISNDEFHCKYLEYFRRLYADESESHGDDDVDVITAAGYDNDVDDYDDDDVSAIQVRGRVKHYGDNGDEEPTGMSTDESGGEVVRAKIMFPIDRAMVRGGGSRVTVIRSVVRIYGSGGERRSAADVTTGSGHLRVRVYGRLLSAGEAAQPWEKPSHVGDLVLPPGGGRWSDVDVTRLLRPRKRHHETGNATLELTLRCSPEAAGIVTRFDGKSANAADGAVDRLPVLHAFLDGDGARSLTSTGTAATVPCTAAGQTRRKKRDVDGGGKRGRRRRPAAASAGGRVRRTDCKVDAATGNGNGTESGHGGGGNKCCREEMRVVFADIPGFDFIVEPKWFDAGLCRGRCPAKYNPATRHAFIQSLLWKQHNNNNNNNRKRGRRKVRHGGSADAVKSQPAPPPKPCCAPSKLDRLQIIHVDESNPNTLKVSTWKEMAVVECACS